MAAHLEVHLAGGELHHESALTTAKHLSPFQKEKFAFLFNAFFDIKKNHLIEEDDMVAFTEKLRMYTKWDKDSANYQEMADIHSTFYECICDQVKAEFQAEDVSEEDSKISWEDAFKKYGAYDVKRMTLQQWLNMWGRLCYGSAGIADFPIWVQLLPNLFFRVIDRDEDGILSANEIKKFYHELIGIQDPIQLDKISKEGYRAMTANGDYVLNKENYYFCFANFLLGKGIYGPGKYVFGVFDNRELDEQFPIKYNEEE